MPNMGFCQRCGILLPVKHQAALCKACHSNENDGKVVCECEFCGKDRPKEDVLKHFRPRPISPRPAQEVGESTQNVFGSQNEAQWQPCVSKSKKKKSPRSNSSHSSSPRSDDMSSKKQIKKPFPSPRGANNRSDLEPTIPESESSRPETYLKENAVDEDLRNKWQRKQTEYKRQLCKTDTPDIAALVSGQRRKPDGSRYYVGGVDISFIKENSVDACACITVVQMPDLEVVYQRMEMVELTQPYIPGFLAFREVPALEKLFSKLRVEAPKYLPDIILVDGNGTLHPRGLGLACQLGILLDVPTMGVAKTLMSAQGIVDDAQHRAKKQKLQHAGDGFDLIADSGEVLGRCVRVHDKAPNPVYVSVGHNISLDSAVWLALECSMYRVPEPIRRADLDSREYIRKSLKEPQVLIN